MVVLKSIKEYFFLIIDFIRYNLFLIILTGIFAFRTIFMGSLNYALLIFLIALLLLIICQIIFRYSEKKPIRLIYQILILGSFTLIITAMCIQTLRFIDVFVPTLTEPTIPKIMVRIGIITLNFYVFALFFAIIYYLYTHDMLSVIWNGSIKKIFNSPRTSKDRSSEWRRERFSSLVLLNIFMWGGLATIITLLTGFIAWLLR